jgi:hypothetical protein
MNLRQLFWIILAGTSFAGCDRQYRSRVTLEVRRPDAEAAIMAQLPQGDDTVALKRVRNTDLYQITVSHRAKPQVAADRANQFVVAVMHSIGEPNGQAVKLLEKAEPAPEPTRKYSAETR